MKTNRKLTNEALNKVQDSNTQNKAGKHQPAEDQTMKDKSVKDQAVNNKPENLESLNEESLKKAAAETPAPDQTATDTPAEDPANPEAVATEAENQVNLLEKLAAEVKDIEDKNLRLAAEMENLRRRTEREKQDMAKFAITNFARDVLSIDDNLQRALQSVPEAAIEEDDALKALCEGVEMTGRELLNVFERYGITKLDPKGEIFDPNCHQAMFEIPNPEVPAGTIMEVVAPGFMIESRVLRPAMVGIAKGGEKPVKEAEPAAENTNETPAPEETGQDAASDDGIDKTA